MNENPYAVPQAPIEVSQGAPLGDGEPQPWDISDVLTQAWELFKTQWPILLGTYVVGMVIIFAVSMVFQVVQIGLAQVSESAALLGLVAMVGLMAQYVAQAFIQVGLNRIFISASRGQEPEFGVLFSGGDRFLPMLGTFVLLGIAMTLGMLALLVGAIVVALGFFLATYFIADTNMGVVDAFKASWAATSGHKLQMFLLFLVIGLLNFAGMIPCGLGLLVTLPVSFLVMSILYTRLSGRMTAEQIT